MEKESKPNTSSSTLPNNFSLLDMESGLKAGPGSLTNERVRGKCCKICKRNGFSHEPIIWCEIPHYNEDKTVEMECVPYDYFNPSVQTFPQV